MAQCIKCSVKLTSDEIGIYKKLVNRSAKEFMCKKCLAGYFCIDEKLIDDKIKHFREMGCTLFTK